MKLTFYYLIKPFLPRYIQILLRQLIAKRKRSHYQHIWPIDPDAGNIPENWSGWPNGKKFALVLSHDVDTQKGFDAIPNLLDIEKKMGFKSTFNIVPERYRVSQDTIELIKQEGFGVSVHGLKHDGKLFKSKKIFDERAIKINEYLKQWGSNGFTSPSMISNLDWQHDLNIAHSICTFDTDPFEPKPTPSKTIFPLVITNEDTGCSYVELPYTLPQDHTLFIILKEADISIWKKKLKWIAEKGGMALLNTHPDYIQFDDKRCSYELYPKSFYVDFLQHITTEYGGQFWNALPSDVSHFWRSERKEDQQGCIKSY